MYKNPTPSLDDKLVSKQFAILFEFDEPITLEEAMDNFNQMITQLVQTNQPLHPNWFRMLNGKLQTSTSHTSSTRVTL